MKYKVRVEEIPTQTLLSRPKSLHLPTKNPKLAYTLKLYINNCLMICNLGRIKTKNMEESVYDKRTQDIKEAIIKLLFWDGCKSITSESIKFKTHCYNVNIERVVRDINSLNAYPFITCISNGKGVLKLSV